VNTELLQLACAGLHPDRLRGLVDTWGSPGSVIAAAKRGAVKMNDRALRAIQVDGTERSAQLATAGVVALAGDDPGFPARLSGRPDAPLLVFVRGSVPDAPTVAVVGTRKCTAYGRRLAHAYGAAIAVAGWVLVSGLARGIDGAAHRGTVSERGRGVAVLGCGLDVPYPREHETLASELARHAGAVISEYPLGTPPEAWRFPPRNRVISGMADAVVVVEAGVKGGALITAGTALEQGVPVFAVPGDVGRDASRGTNLLIRDGAHPVLDPIDLIEALALVVGPPVTSASGGPAADDEVAALVGSGAHIDEIAAHAGLAPREALAMVGRWVADGAAVWDGSRVVPAYRASVGDR
jgi:DNA processing protein